MSLRTLSRHGAALSLMFSASSALFLSQRGWYPPSLKSRGRLTSDRILNSTMAQIASRVAELNGEGALSVFARAKELEKQGRSIIHLELGEPDFHPAMPVVDALRSAVAAGRDRYVSPRGIPPLREAVADYLRRTRDVHAAPDQLLIAP